MPSHSPRPERERPDPAVFAREVLSVLRHTANQQFLAATGLSEHYCSLIRLGRRVPHPRHREAQRHA
jgi:hypothetical protein